MAEEGDSFGECVKQVKLDKAVEFCDDELFSMFDRIAEIIVKKLEKKILEEGFLVDKADA